MAKGKYYTPEYKEQALGYVLVGVLTAGFALLTAQTVIALKNGTFLPRAAAADQASAAPAGSASSAG